VDLEMTAAERRELLALGHVGVLAVEAGDGPPLVTPVWYAPEQDGDLVVVTDRTSRKARLLRAAGRAVFLVHEDVPPRHVSIEADVLVEEPDARVRRRIAERYMPPDHVDGYLAATAAADTVVIRLRPRRWRSADLSRAAV
jgi:PPOX class probable F420-dependent enzyme